MLQWRLLMIQLISQLAVALLVLAGGGFWVWLGTGRQPLARRGWWIWCLLAGVAIHTLVLQQLWYLGLRISFSSWGSAAIALTGTGGWIREYFCRADQERRAVHRLLLAAFGMAMAVCFVQGWSVAQRGPAHYYGRAEYDQFNYVITAQFLIDHGPTAPIGEVAGSPLLLKAFEASAQRITQSVLHAELSVLSLSDAQASYGAVTLCFLLLLGLAVMGFLLAVGVSAGIAAAGGAGAALLPAVTAVQLNGFLSQTSVLWTLIALSGALARAPWTWREALVAGSFLAFLFGAYTEFSPFGFGAAVLVVLLTVPREKRVVVLGILLMVALGLNVGFLGRAADFFAAQLSDAGDAGRLASWMPGSGTWMGLGRNFAPDLPSSILTAIGVGVTLIFAAALGGLTKALRVRAAALTAMPLVALGTLLLLPKLPAYAFGKLLISVTPPLFTVIILGAMRSARVLRPVLIAAVFCIAGFSVWDVVLAQKELVDGTGKIERVDLISVVERAKVSKKETGTPPVFLISAEDSLSAAWLYYHCRKQNCYLINQEMSDRIYPSAWHAFRRPTLGMNNVYLTEPGGISAFPNYDAYPTINVTGGTRHNEGVVEKWNSGGELTFTIDFSGSRPARLRWFCFQLNAEQGNRFEVMVDTPGGAGIVSSGPQWAVPMRADAGHYELRLRSKLGQPFSLTFFGLEPVHQPARLPYRFELVPLSIPRVKP